MEYLVIQLMHDKETDSEAIQAELNKWAFQGWVLHSTQFLPWDKKGNEYIPVSGHLVLIFQRSLSPLLGL